MLELLNTVELAISQASMMTLWESVAVLMAIAYLVLAMKCNIWCWAAAFFSTAIYTVLFWHVSLLMESVLNVYYMAMAFYGFWLWQQSPKQPIQLSSFNAQDASNQSTSSSGIISLSIRTHLKLIAATAFVSVVLGYVMANYTNASFAYLDSATTCFAVMTTYLVAKKVLENWLYWVVIDVVSIYLYFNKGLMLTSGLFILYVGMAISGYFMWRKQFQQSASYVKTNSNNLSSSSVSST